MKTRTRIVLQLLAVAGLTALLAAPAAAAGGKDHRDRGGRDCDCLKLPSAQGKYTHLLRKIEVPNDRDTYGDFNDYGYWDGTEWAGYTNLPPGYWVYVAPYWYVWGDVTGR